MQYVEVQSLEKHAEKIEKQLNLIMTTKPGIYAKTKDRYKRLAYSLLKSAEMISSILEEESLVPFIDSAIDDEFNELADSQEGLASPVDLQNTVAGVHQKIDSCSQFTQSSSTKLMPNKDIMCKFASIIEQGASISFEYLDVIKCASLLNKWMRNRFFPDVRNPGFRYSLKQLPTWITYMIIAYGKYKKANRVEEFINLVDKWINEIQNNSSNTYTLPYEVFELMKSNNPEDFTMEAVLISDVLMEEYLYQLTEPYLSGSSIFLSCSPVVDVVKVKNPQIMPLIRKRIANQVQLFDEHNFKRVDSL